MIPWLRPVNLRDAFIKDQKALAADISLKRSALQAVLDRDEDGGGTMVRSAIKSCWGSPRQNCCLLWFKCCLLEKNGGQTHAASCIWNYHQSPPMFVDVVLDMWVLLSFKWCPFLSELPHVTLTTSQQKNSPKATAGPSSLESLVQVCHWDVATK